MAKMMSTRKPKQPTPVKDMTPRKGPKAGGNASASASGNTIYVSTSGGGVWKTT